MLAGKQLTYRSSSTCHLLTMAIRLVVSVPDMHNRSHADAWPRHHHCKLKRLYCESAGYTSAIADDSSHVELSGGLQSQDFTRSDPSLCNVCNSILQNEVELGSDCKHPHQSNLFELERAAQDACHLCRLIVYD